MKSELDSEDRWDVPIDKNDAKLRYEIVSQSCVLAKEDHVIAEADISEDHNVRVLQSRKVPRPQL